MDMNSERKIKIFKYVMNVLKNNFILVDMNTYATIFVRK
jgi:hypothetical protein